MRAAIDSAGRLVVPKAVREEMKLEPGTELELRIQDGTLVLEPLPTPVALVQRGKVVVAKAKHALPKLTAAEVRDAIERTRR